MALVSGSLPVAEDAVQEALARAWERSERGLPMSSLPAFVTAVAHNLLRDRFRRLRVERRARRELADRARARSTLSRVDERTDLVRALATLPARQREVAAYHYLLDWDVVEIAHLLGIPEGTVKSALFRARRSLAQVLRIGDGDPKRRWAMSRVDDVIRRDLRRSSVGVDVRAAFERVDRRRRRLRAARRLRVVALAVVVTAGAIGAGVGLVSLFEHGRRSQIGGSPSPFMEPNFGPEAEEHPLCGASSAVADLDGDGSSDRIEVGVPAPGPDVSCDQVELRDYVARIELATGTDRARSFEQRLPECDIEAICWLLATPDLGADGTAEAAIAVSTGASTISFALYRFDAATPDEPLRRLRIAEPGDPWHEEFGFPPGPATFSWYGSVTHRHWLSCDEDPEHRLAAITVLRAYDAPKDRHLEDVHGVLFALEGSILVAEFTWDEQVPEATLEAPPEMCGSPMHPRPTSP